MNGKCFAKLLELKCRILKRKVMFLHVLVYLFPLLNRRMDLDEIWLKRIIPWTITDFLSQKKIGFFRIANKTVINISVT